MAKWLGRPQSIGMVKLSEILKGLTKPMDNDKGAYTNGDTLRAVCALACASKPEHILEIGTAHGHTAVHLAKVCPNAHVWTLGTCQEMVKETHSPFRREILPRVKQGSIIRQQPTEIRARISGFVSTPDSGRHLLGIHGMPSVQFAFIDGDHTWRSVVGDTEAVLRHLNPGGTIVWDDYGQALDTTAFINVLNGRIDHIIQRVTGTRIAFVKLDRRQRIEMLEALGDL